MKYPTKETNEIHGGWYEKRRGQAVAHKSKGRVKAQGLTLKDANETEQRLSRESQSEEERWSKCERSPRSVMNVKR